MLLAPIRFRAKALSSAFLFGRPHNSDAQGWGFMDKRSDFPLPEGNDYASLLHHLATFVSQPLLIALTPTTAYLVTLLPTPRASRDGGRGGGLAGPFDPTA